MTGTRMHKRESAVSACQNKLALDILHAFDDAGLTEGERLRILAGLFGEMVGSMAKYAIRLERHGRADVPGGLER